MEKRRATKKIVLMLAIFALQICLSIFANNKTYAAEKFGEIYEVSDGCITKILPETTLQDLKNNIDNQNVEVINKAGVAIKENELVATGMTLEANGQTYTLAVKGDVNGTGKIGITDVVRTQLASVHLIELQGASKKAADINGDEKITITDLTQINLASIQLKDFIAPATFVPKADATETTIKIEGKIAAPNAEAVKYYFEINNNGWVKNEDETINTYEFTNLNQGTQYSVRMKAEDKAGNTKITERITLKTKNSEVYAKLYDDGLLAFTATDKTLSGKTVSKDYGEITGAQTGLYSANERNSITSMNIIDNIQHTSTKTLLNGRTNLVQLDNMANLKASNVALVWENERDNITCVDFVDKIQPTSTANWFIGCQNLTRIDNISNLDTSNVTDMSNMFGEGCGLGDVDLSHFDTSNVTNMSQMFACSAMVNINISNFNTSKVTNMARMFSGCDKLEILNLGNIDTSNVTDMSGMFAVCKELTNLDVSKFNTSNVTNMENMFWGCNKLTNIDVSKFDTSKVTNMTSMFSECWALTNLDVSNFDTSNVISMGGLASWDGMFNECTNLTSLNLSNFDTRNVTDMRNMFRRCRKLTTIYVGANWSTSQANTTDMFEDCGTSTVTTK